MPPPSAAATPLSGPRPAAPPRGEDELECRPDGEVTLLLSAGRLLKIGPRRAAMRFYRRDLVLLAASVLFTLAGAMYLGAYAIGIGAALFFGMKMIAVRRQEAVDRQVGEGLCAECGQRVVGGACPECGGPDGEQAGQNRPAG